MVERKDWPQVDAPKQLIRLLLLRQASGLPRVAGMPIIVDDVPFTPAPRPISAAVWEALWLAHLSVWPNEPDGPERVHSALSDAGLDPGEVSQWLIEHLPVRALESELGRERWDAAAAIEMNSGLETIGVLPIEGGWSHQTSPGVLLVPESTRLDPEQYRKLVAATSREP